MTEKNADEYLTVSSQPVTSEIKVSDSKFITQVFHVLSKHQAESVYSNIKRKYHDASHNCFAYRISSPLDVSDHSRSPMSTSRKLWHQKYIPAAGLS